MHCGSPEYVGVGEAVHELHLPEHVGLVAGHGVHLKGHHLPCHPVLHLRTKKRHPNHYLDELKTSEELFTSNVIQWWLKLLEKCD